MKLDIIPCLNDNYSYLIKDNNSGIVAIIDPSEYGPCENIINQKYKKLDFILNTHHHFDHVGGNKELKKKYRSKVLGFEKDKERIPEIDILLKKDQEFKIGDLNFKTLFVPGHTSGHIAFHLKKEKILFTGDTLFSLGCGRLFEGTHKQMFDSLKKFKSLPIETKIYCGHEYTKNNLAFCLKFNPNNNNLKDREKIIDKMIIKKKPTIPSTIKDEIETNIFLRYDDQDVRNTLNLKKASDLEIFIRLRDLKDNF